MSFYKRKPFKVGNKTLDQRFGANKKTFFAKFCIKFVSFFNVFSAFWIKKRWLKYTTNNIIDPTYTAVGEGRVEGPHFEVHSLVNPCSSLDILWVQFYR